MASQALQEHGDYLTAALAKESPRFEIAHGEAILTLPREAIVRALTFLRDDGNCLFKMLIDICGVDYPDRAERFEVVYNLLSLKHNRRIRVKVATGEDTPVPSVSSVYSAPPAGSSGKPGTSTASSSPIIPICAGSSPTTGSRVIRCARTSR